MSTTTTVTGPIETLEASALEGKYIRFTLLTSGTETGTGDLVAASTKSYVLDASGDFSATLWVNGESGVESVYRIEIPGDNLAYEVIIPTSAGGGTISVEDLIENHQVSGSSPQQASTLAQAQAYTDSELDAFAADPSSRVSLDPAEWRSDLGLDIGVNVQAWSSSLDSVNQNLGTSDNPEFSTLTVPDQITLFSRVINGIETTVTDDDDLLCTSGAVVDYVAANSAKSGFVDYNDTTGDVSLTTDTWTDVPNNTLGAFTNTTYIPSGVTSLIDDTTGYLDFTDLDLGREILIRNDFTINPSTNNALLQVRYVLGTGAGEYALLFWSERLDSGSGVDYPRVLTFPIYMGDTNTRDNPGKLQVKLSTTGTLNNNGSYISVK